MGISEHYQDERLSREELIKRIGEGQVVKTKIIDRGHPNGAELHCVTDTGIIIIYNVITGIMVTKLIGRPSQIKRVYGEERVPTAIWQLAIEHQRLRYNEV